MHSTSRNDTTSCSDYAISGNEHEIKSRNELVFFVIFWVLFASCHLAIPTFSYQSPIFFLA